MTHESATDGFNETFRPRIHFTPARNWINDPNGLIYLDGEYHLFFQYNPFGDRWGHMSWGHAVSDDLLHWRSLPVAIFEHDGIMAYSGSIVVDTQNTAGFGEPNSQAPMVAIYTAARASRQAQSLAFSRDHGRTWTEFEGNPVLDLQRKDFRDPKVFWHAPTRRWIMVTVLSDLHQVAFFGSVDLKHWTHLSNFGPAGAFSGDWECPDLFELTVPEAAGETRWVLKVDVFKGSIGGGSGGQYFVGNFDGSAFVPERSGVDGSVNPPARWVDYGKDFYAAASWGGLGGPDSRHVWIAWMNNHEYAQELPTTPWRGAMTIPREVRLQRSPDGLELVQVPARELESLRRRHQHRTRIELGSTPTPIGRGLNLSGAYELDLRVSAAGSVVAGVKVHVSAAEQTLIAYDPARHRVYLDRNRSGRLPAPSFSDRAVAPVRDGLGDVHLRIIVDRSSVEVFVNDGESVITEQIFPSTISNGVELFATGGQATVSSLDVWELNPVVAINTPEERQR